VHFNNLSTKIPVTSVLLIIVKKACLFTVSILLLAAVPVASKVIHSEGFKWIQSPLKITLCQRVTESGKFSSSKDAIASVIKIFSNLRRNGTSVLSLYFESKYINCNHPNTENGNVDRPRYKRGLIFQGLVLQIGFDGHRS
jgi:hypothetical protein